jgi:hypothetical protein
MWLRSRPAAAVAHQCGDGELTNKRKNWNRIRVFGDDRHRGQFAAREMCIGKDIRRAYPIYAKVDFAFREECSHERTGQTKGAPARCSFLKTGRKQDHAPGEAVCYTFAVGLGVPFGTQSEDPTTLRAGSTSPDGAINPRISRRSIGRYRI